MIKKSLYFALILLTLSCKNSDYKKVNFTTAIAVIEQKTDTLTFTNGFDYPIGKPDAKGYYNTQKFGSNNHLGDDWNGINGGNSDLGDPVYAIANGYVTFAQDIKGGWGNVVRITHYLNETEQVESLYAHGNEILVKKGDYVKKGVQIATIGTANGQYLAHLHFELRSKIGMPIGGGYSANTSGYLNPSVYIKVHRK